jgi:hypothetical protein
LIIAVLFWGNCSNEGLNRILKLQKRTARLILDQDPIAPSEPLFKQLGWIKVQFLPLGYVIFHLQHFGESTDFYQTSTGFYFLNI